ncbi:DNA polymerase III subunit delta [candidate division WOR-3 bacterium]|nr:DNA polymerase III subunit delta [candidate division WOR-3 bacterium]
MGSIDYLKAKKEIERGVIKNSYLLAGENEFLKEEIITLLEETLINKKTRLFDRTKFYGDELPDNLHRQITSLPISSKRHLSIIRSVDKIKKEKGKKEIKKLLKLSSPYLCIVLTDGKQKKKRSQFLNWLLSNTETVWCKNFSEDAIKRWVSDKVKDRGRDISRDAVSLLVDFVGDDMYSLSSEIRKLLSFKSEGRVDREDIEKIVGIDRLSSVYELESAICRKNIKKGMKALNNLLLWGEKPGAILYRLGKWLMASSSGRPWKNGLEFRDAAIGLSTLTEIEVEIREGRIDDRFAVEEFVYKLCKTECKKSVYPVK